LGISFESLIPSVQEARILSSRNPAADATSLAVHKVSGHGKPDALILGMDTLVVLGNRVLGKPESRADAARMLRALSGRSHLVVTAIALKYRDRLVTGAETTKVHFRKIDRSEMDWYLNSGEYLDKAGAYGIQGLARIFVKRIVGCYFNVVGFPIFCFQRTLRRLGFRILDLIGSESSARSKR
jgi:septum formation protein